MTVVELSRRSGISAVAFDVIWWKDDRNGGEIERRVESETKEMREKGDGDTGGHKHRENRNQGNQYFIQ